MNSALLQKTITGILCAVIAGVVLQGVIAVVADVNFSQYALLIKSWKEILLGVGGLLLLYATWQSNAFKTFLHDKILWLIAGIGALHVLLLLLFDNHYVGELAALLIDLRFYVLFAECYIAVRLWPQVARPIKCAAAGGVAFAMLFALLQVTVLPKDILSHIGYSKATIQPYLTVDLNPNYVRINSTLRGPNPLGALAMIALSLGAAMWLRRVQPEGWRRWLMWAVMVGSLAALWSSYSRSAWLAMMVAAVAIAVAVGVQRISRRMLGAILGGMVMMVAVIWFLQDTPVVQNLVFHTNPDSPTVHKSDHGHKDSLEHGTQAMLEQPWGAGLGSTGSASLLTEEPVIIENQYFYMAHESGWLGVLLQLGLFGWILLLLWRHRLDALSLGLFASGVGLFVIGLVLPVWADDTVALVWWGLAGMAVASYYKHKENTRARKNHKKTTRTA